MLDKLPHGRIVSYVSVMLIEWLTVVLMLSEEPLPNLARVSALIIEGSAPRARDGGKRDRRNDRAGHRPHSEEKAAAVLATVFSRTAAPET